MNLIGSNLLTIAKIARGLHILCMQQTSFGLADRFSVANLVTDHLNQCKIITRVAYTDEKFTKG